MIEENMDIVEYSKEYDEQIKDLLVQLQEYLVKIDDLDIEILYKDYDENIRNKKVMPIIESKKSNYLQKRSILSKILCL